MQEIMSGLREKPLEELGTLKICSCKDYKKGADGLPASDVLKYVLEDGSSLIIRPSGTEPKLKAYVSAIGNNQLQAQKKNQLLSETIKNIFNSR